MRGRVKEMIKRERKNNLDVILVGGIMVYMCIRELMPATLKYIKSSVRSISKYFFILDINVYAARVSVERTWHVCNVL